jgi:Ala-tRNA(Pro) deacylase
MGSEEDMDQLFPDCERGAMTPFGSLYHIPTVVDESLTHDDRIVFEAQCHEEVIRMKYSDFESMEHPQIGHFARC